MRYTDSKQAIIDAGNDWQTLGFYGQFIPVCQGNRDYDKIINENIEVLPFEEPVTE